MRDRFVEVSEPKTHASRRTILLPPDTIQVLRDHALNQELSALIRSIPFIPGRFKSTRTTPGI